VAHSTCEAEYYSATDATKEGLHLHQLKGEIFNAPITETTTIWEDNKNAFAYSQNALVSKKTKHIGQKWHFLKDNVEQGTIKWRYLPTVQMVADMFTEPFPWPALTRHRSAILGEIAMQKTQCIASFRSYLHGGCCKYYLLVISCR
jgi:hypothetical protein